MSRLSNQIKKDLAHQRWALAGVGALLLAHLLVSGFQILHHVPNPQPSTEEFASLVASWVVFSPLLFVLLLVQADTPVGTSAFWLTRPLRGERMLVAKALSVFPLFVLLPLAVEILILLLRGAGTSTWLAIPEFSVVRLPLVMGAFALGAATERFLHALTLGAAAAALGIITMLSAYFIFHGAADGSAPQPFSGSRGIVTLWTLAAVFTAVVVMQFLTRREGASRCLLAVGIGGAMILHSIWNWNILGRSPQREDASPAAIEVRIDPRSITINTTTTQGSSRKGPPKRHFSLPIQIGGAGLSASQFRAPISSRIELLTSSSAKFAGSASYPVIPTQQNYRAALAATLSPLGIELISQGRLATSENYSNSLSHRLAIDDAQFERLHTDLEEIHVLVDVGEFGFERAAELPFEEGAVWRDQGDEIEILKIRKQGDSLRIKIREQQLSLIFSERNAYGRFNRNPWVLLLVNPKTKTAVVLDRYDSTSMSYRGTGWISPFLRREEWLELHLRHELGSRHTPESTEHWLNESTLAIVRKRNLGKVRVQHVVETHNVQLNHPSSP